MRIPLLENESLQYLKFYAESCKVSGLQICTVFNIYIAKYLYSRIAAKCIIFKVQYLQSTLPAEIPEMTKMIKMTETIQKTQITEMTEMSEMTDMTEITDITEMSEMTR